MKPRKNQSLQNQSINEETFLARKQTQSIKSQNPSFIMGKQAAQHLKRVWRPSVCPVDGQQSNLIKLYCFWTQNTTYQTSYTSSSKVVPATGEQKKSSQEYSQVVPFSEHIPATVSLRWVWCTCWGRRRQFLWASLQGADWLGHFVQHEANGAYRVFKHRLLPQGDLQLPRQKIYLRKRGKQGGWGR